MLTNYRRLITLVVIFSLVFTYIVLPTNTNAASLTEVSATLSDSDVQVNATTTISFKIGTTLEINDYVEVVYPSGFGTLATTSIDCSGVSTGATTTVQDVDTVRCTLDEQKTTTTVLTVVVADLANPSSTGSKTITINTYNSGDTLRDSGTAMVAIVDGVDVSASVPATLTFTISPTNTSTVINSATTTGSTATTSIEFGEIQSGAANAKIMGQELKVVTNASGGFTVTVQQNRNLSNGGSADIDSFVEGTASTTAQAWASPVPVLDSENTYGHMGVTTEDDVLSSNQFTADTWKGLNGTTPLEVMFHNGPADGSSAGKGATEVAYKIELSALQESGDYTNNLTYICTPIY